MPHPQMAAQLYRQLLEVLSGLLTNLTNFKHHWEAEDEKLTLSEE